MTVVDAVVRLAGMGAKALVVVAARAAPEERCRRRGQVRRLNPSPKGNKRLSTRQVCTQACMLVTARCGATAACMCLRCEAHLCHAALLPLLGCLAQAHCQ